MSTLTLTPLVLDRVDGEPTLDALITGAWEGLSVRRAVRCPVCAGEMEPFAGPDLDLLGGRCTDCGSTLG